MFGNEIQRVTGRKDEFHEVEEFICNTCRFDKKEVSDWVIEGPTKISRQSVISANHYIGAKKPQETIADVMGGRQPKLLMDIHEISDVNDPSVDLSEIAGPATGATFNNTNQ